MGHLFRSSSKWYVGYWVLCFDDRPPSAIWKQTRFLMFCINVVSCYTELTRKGMLLTVLNGKKGRNSNFLTGIQPVTFSDFDLVV